MERVLEMEEDHCQFCVSDSYHHIYCGYHSPGAPNAGDWFEIYNPNKYKVDISGWRVYDGEDNNPMIFRPNTVIDGNAYLVICESIPLFEKAHPKVYNRLGGMGFKLSNDGEVIKLYDAENKFVDSVSYKDKKPWAENADGDGPSLELISPDLDNNTASNWHTKPGHGTPGKVNSVVTNTKDLALTYFRLFQNYPNPVKEGMTYLEYTLNKKGNVKLNVRDHLGREVLKVVDEDQIPGTYKVQIPAKRISSGLYIVQLEFDHKYTQTIKMAIVN